MNRLALNRLAIGCAAGLALAIGMPNATADAASPASVMASGNFSAILPALGTTVAKAVMKYFGREGIEEATEYMSRKGGQEMVVRVTAAAAREGGEVTVERVAKLTSQHGPDAVAALDNAPSIAPLLRSLDEIPEPEVKTALSRLAAGPSGRELAETVSRHGATALKAELAHPGVGGMLVRSLGQDGGEIAAKLSTDQAITLARHADDIAALPVSQRTGLLSLIRQDTERFVAFIARFVEANPGKTLFTAAGTTIILAESERMLGGDEIVFDADGNPIVVTKPGVIGRPAKIAGEVGEHISNRYLQPAFYALLAFAVVFGSIYMWRKINRSPVTDES